ncbi:hypothetical protein [Asticcacaulis taihuensis]|uniref:Uncharacterized protein n=1 Tax=Asticcacaulis taihuensis TaxID=260084 RepID=A0A1G4SSD3_9CAUL|nr:hypothetical protein [Asticcacaulis taihuensis]SCW71199.1 hypothetical protein SAMN02927928_2812 [Asticcacaulis taihuensis]
MQDTDTLWLNIRKAQEKNASDFAFERRRLQQAEDLLTSEISDDLLLNLHLFAMDFEMENACYAVLKRQTEDLLLERMAGGKDDSYPPSDFIGAKDGEAKRALEAAISNTLPNRELLGLFLYAECLRFMDDNGPTWQAVFDLTRLQILRRMQGFRIDTDTMSVSNTPDDATMLSSTSRARCVRYG